MCNSWCLTTQNKDFTYLLTYLNASLKIEVDVVDHNIHNDGIRWRISTLDLIVSVILTLKCLILIEYNMLSDVIQLQILMSIKLTMRIFALALTVSETLTLQMIDLDNLDQGHRVQHSVANINLYKSHSTRIFTVAFIVSGIFV